jgi:hypothetical protein
MKDVKQKHQQKLIEQKIQEEREQKEKEYIASVMEGKKYDWRKKLNEQMTTSDIFFSTLPATGDVNLANPSWNIQAGEGYSVSDGTVTISGSGGGLFGNGVAASFDTSSYTTLVFDVNITGDEILGVFGNSPSPILVALSSGTYSVSLENILLFVVPFSGSVQINNLRYQRRTPMNVFVPLGSPEATSFIRADPNLSNLSPEERNKKLREMLSASDEYVEKMLGIDFPGTGAVAPGEYDPFAQAPAGEAGDTPGVDIDNWIAGGLYPSNKYDPIKSAPYIQDPKIYGGGGKSRSPNVDPWDPNDPSTWPTIKQASGSQDTQIAQQWTDDPSTWPSIKNPVKTQPAIIDPKTGWPSVPKVPPSYRGKPGGQQVRMAHYEPQGELISERKKLKSPEEVLNKIPGYYTGKPAPLGFPVEQPPKMVNGMHPDLVDGKLISQRFNRMDPQSAQAMPKTGNPHIDKKVEKTKKQPK